MNMLHHLGTSDDRQQRTTLARSDTSRSQLVATARDIIYTNNLGVDSAAVESILKSHSWVPNNVGMPINLLSYLCLPFD